MERPLGPVERVIYQLDRTSPLNFTSVALVKGPLTERMVQVGLTAVRARHPYLRARIAVDEMGRPAFRDDGAAPSLRTVAGGDWIAEAEREVNDPISTESGPLVRCVVVEHAAEHHTLLLTFHHSIGDGMSGAYLMRDLVTAAAAAVDGGAPSLSRLEDTRAVDERFPASARGLPGWLRRMRYLLRSTWITLRNGNPLKVRRDREAFAYARRARLIHEVLDDAFAARLTARSRAEGTTVHGALSAAILLGVLRDAGTKGRAHVGFGIPVNVRKELDPAVGEDLGFYISMLAYRGTASAGQDPWALARSIRDDTTATMGWGGAFASLGMLASFFRSLGGFKLEPRALAERWERSVPATAGLTNLGRLPIETHFGGLDIEEVHFFAAPGALGDFISTATSLHGRLFWNFVWTDPVLEAEHARALVGDIVVGLRRAVDG
jgi:hypothetical protein